MKRMTCQQLGGPCDLTHEGETADEIINSQDAHLKEMVASGLDDGSARLRDPTATDAAS